jgi:hypothetical protein
MSPTDIVVTNNNQYKTWTQHADLSTNTGYIEFSNPSTELLTIFPLTNKNGLWYYSTPYYQDINQQKEPDVPIINRISTSTLYELYHARLGHPGERVMKSIHKHVTGIPQLRKPDLYKCGTCMLVNATKRAISSKEVDKKITKENLSVQSKLDPVPTSQQRSINTSKDQQQNIVPGQRFHMDMGFVRGTQYSTKDVDGNIVTSIDGFNSYLSIVDRATRYTWVFLSKSKHPQVKTIKSFLTMHATTKTVQKYVRTDEGDWVEQDLLILHRIPTSENVADAMTKTLSRTLFYRHYDTYMGRRVPDHCKNSGKENEHLCLQPSKTPGRVPNPAHARQPFLKTPAEHGGGD